jgi:lipopolysaccharide exporter
MRDTLVVTRTFFPKTGGIEEYVYNRCQQESDRIWVLAASCTGDRSFDREQIFPVYRWSIPKILEKGKFRSSILKQIVNMFWSFWLGFLLYKRYSYQYLEWGHGYDFPSLLLLSYLVPAKCTVYLHGDDILCPLRNPLLRSLFSLTLRRMDKIVCNSCFTRDYVKQHFQFDTSIQVINPLVRPEKFCLGEQNDRLAELGAKIRQKYQIPATAVVILKVARLVRRKGIDRVINCLPFLLDRGIDVHYPICGKGKMEAELKDLAANLKVSDRVHFAGFVPDRELADYYLAIVPPSLHPLVRESIGTMLSLMYRGDNVVCPCCGNSFSSFAPGGVNNRPNAMCPRCGAFERHRLLWLYLQQQTNLFSQKLKVLHFAPEYMLQKKFKQLENLDYTSADLNSPLASVKADITVLVYKGLEDKKLVNAVYSLTVNISLAMFVLQIIAGLFVAWFFGESKVWQLNACAALVFLFGAGSGSHGAVLQRQIKFKELAIADSVGGLARFGSAIASAAMGWGVWSFAIAEVAMTIALAILRRYFSKYSFNYHFSPDPIAVKEVKGYINKIIGVNLAVYANTNSDNLLIGKLISTQALGYYNIAYQLAMLPTFALSKINQINFSVLSQQDKEEKQIYLGKILEIYALIYSLLYGLGFIVSPWLIPTVYGKDWTPAVILFQIISIFAYARGLMAILGTTLNALNKPGTNAKINWLLVPFSIPAFYLGAQWKGVEGVAIAAALVMGIGATIWFWFATCRSAEWSLTILIKPVLIPTISTILAIVSVLVTPFPTSWQIILQPLVLIIIYGIAISLFSAGRIPLILIKQGLGTRG